MNKYLLLRDNKQSGPYTVPEIVAIGIKPYDLVWLDGKSAAWRYPSEVEELKAYAPLVEEQPFDRFYKKPQSKTPVSVPAENERGAEKTEVLPEIIVAAERHDAYQPKIPAVLEHEKPGKKVYINLPAAAAVQNAAVGAQTIDRPSKPAYDSADRDIKKPTPPASPFIPVRESYLQEPRTATKHESPAKKDNKMLQVALAACILLGIVSGILFFNYNSQRQTLNELNTLVRSIENREKQQVIPSAIVQTDVPAEPAPEPPQSETSEAAIIPSAGSAETVSQTRKTPSPQAQARTTSPTEENAAIVFRENKPGERPVDRRDQPAETAKPEAASSNNNLYSLVEVAPNAYKTGLLGGISNLKFSITNKSEIELHRVAIEVKFLGPEKRIVKRQMIYFENVAPGGESTVDVPKSNRGVSVEYTITDIKS